MNRLFESLRNKRKIKKGKEFPGWSTKHAITVFSCHIIFFISHVNISVNPTEIRSVETEANENSVIRYNCTKEVQ